MPLKQGSLYEQPYQDLFVMEFLDGVYSNVHAWSTGKPSEQVKKAILELEKMGVMSK